MAAKEQSARDRLRAKTLGAGGRRQEEIVEIDGEKFVVRQPTVAQRSDIFKKCKANTGETEQVDIGEMQVWAVIHCTYTPEGEQVFEEADYEALCNQPTGGFVDALGAAALRLMNEASVEAKNSETTWDGKPSSKSRKQSEE